MIAVALAHPALTALVRLCPSATTKVPSRTGDRQGKDCCQQSFCISTSPGGQMSEGTTPGQGLFLQSYCISTVPGGQKEDDCRDAGGRATQGAVAEVDRAGNSGRGRCMEHDYKDVGVRVAPGAATGLSGRARKMYRPALARVVC